MCHKHFGPETLFIGSRRNSLIRTDAIPTLFLPKNQTAGKYQCGKPQRDMVAGKLNP